MVAVAAQHARVLSGMRPTGRLHLGHYHGVLKNWVGLQHEYECFFFVADWHALTTHYEDPSIVPASVWDMVIDWLAAGIDPAGVAEGHDSLFDLEGANELAEPRERLVERTGMMPYVYYRLVLGAGLLMFAGAGLL